MNKSIYVQRLDKIQSEIDAKILKPNGFKKKGRVHNRNTVDNLIQVVAFQIGQSYCNDNDKFSVHMGIRVPESFERNFSNSIQTKKIYQEYECNIRISVNEPWGSHQYKANNGITYNSEMFMLNSDNIQPIVKEIIGKFEKYVLPFFNDLDTREKVIKNRKNYYNLELSRVCLLEEAMIYGRAGNIEKATQLIQKHYNNSEHKGHRDYIENLSKKLGIFLNISNHIN